MQIHSSSLNFSQLRINPETRERQNRAKDAQKNQADTRDNTTTQSKANGKANTVSKQIAVKRFEADALSIDPRNVKAVNAYIQQINANIEDSDITEAASIDFFV